MNILFFRENHRKILIKSKNLTDLDKTNHVEYGTKI